MVSEKLDLTVRPMEAQVMKATHKVAAHCDHHGAYASVFTQRSDKGSGCPACAEEASRKRDEEIAINFNKQMEIIRLEKRLGGAMIPPRFKGKTFDTFSAADEKQRKVLGVCREYADNFKVHHSQGRSLLLLGNVGTGKTHLAGAIAHHVITVHRMRALYRTVYAILQHVKGSFSKDAEYNESEAFQAFIEPDLLIIDEVGATKTSEFEQQTLFNIINGRYEQMLPTIVISNLMPEELVSALGERCVDRLREGGGIAQVFTWGSVRKSIRAEADEQ